MPIFEIRFIFYDEHLIFVGVLFDQKLEFVNLPDRYLLDNFSAMRERVTVATDDGNVKLGIVNLERRLLLVD